MKQILLLASFALLIGGCGQLSSDQKVSELEENVLNTAELTNYQDAPEAKPEGPLPVMEFETTEHDFGTVKEGDKVSYEFRVKNVGEAPLVIQSTKPSCGCTTPDWTREPIPVGQSGKIKVEFNSSGRVGMNKKTVSIIANTWPKTTTLRFQVNVEEAAD